MDRKAITELHDKSIKELKKQELTLREEIARLRLEKKAGQLKNVHQLKEKRHDLARVLTIIKEKELQEEIAEKLAVKTEEK